MINPLSNRPIFYRLDGTEIVPFSDFLEYLNYMKEIGEVNTPVKKSEIAGFVVSTVFLGQDTNPFHPVPVLFETMIYKKDGHFLNFMRRCCTYKESLEQHKEGCLFVTAIYSNPDGLKKSNLKVTVAGHIEYNKTGAMINRLIKKPKFYFNAI